MFLCTMRWISAWRLSLEKPQEDLEHVVSLQNAEFSGAESEIWKRAHTFSYFEIQ